MIFHHTYNLFHLENRGIIHKLRAHEDVISLTSFTFSHEVSSLIHNKFF
jgi:hypothetical protein